MLRPLLQPLLRPLLRRIDDPVPNALVPSLDLRFTIGGTLDPRVTFTRASGATLVNAQGLIEAVASNAPRFDYDPVTLQPKGLLIEEQRTNSIRNNTMQGAAAGTPGMLPTNWIGSTTNNGVTREIVGTGVEGGINYVDVRVYGTTLSYLYFGIRFEATNGIVATNTQTWASSVYSKLIGGSLTNVSSVKHVLQYSDSASTGLTYTTVTLVPTAQPLISQRSNAIGTATNVATASVVNFLQIEANAGVAIDITLRIGLPQLEQGAFATSVIPTTTAAATRAADVAVMAGANFSSWYRQDEGTFVCSWGISDVASTTDSQHQLVRANNNGLNPTISMRLGYNGTRRLRYYAQDSGGTFEYALDTQTNTNTSGVSAMAYSSVNDFAACDSGGTVVVDNTGSIADFNCNSLQIGNFLNGHIRRIAYFPRRLANSELQAITS